MAKKQQPSPPQPPSVPPERGIELLRRQVVAGEELLSSRPLNLPVYSAWQNTVREVLVRCFGSDSGNISSVMNIGRYGVFPMGASDEWYEQRYAENLEAKLVMLRSCIQQLEMDVEAPVAPPTSHGLALSFDSLHSMIVARCRGLFEAGEYENAVFTAMKCVEDQIRTRIGGDPTDTGVKLVAKAMGSQSPQLVFSEVDAEQQGAASLYRGALAYLKNPSSHRFLGTNDPGRTFEALAFASLLLRMLDEANDAR